jgi:hypothetical protein
VIALMGGRLNNSTVDSDAGSVESPCSPMLRGMRIRPRRSPGSLSRSCWPCRSVPSSLACRPWRFPPRSAFHPDGRRAELRVRLHVPAAFARLLTWLVQASVRAAATGLRASGSLLARSSA